MAYITDRLLTEEFQRLIDESNPILEVTKAFITEPENHPFIAVIDALERRFTIPEEMLHNAPLEVVSDLYLKPLLERFGKL